MVDLSHNGDWEARANRVLPAGDYGNFGSPVFVKRGQGSRVWDVNRREYIDYLIGSGPMLLGHAHPEVNEVVQEQISLGTTFFTSNTHGIQLAEEICNAVACAEQVRYVSTGGEADMYAMRLARAFTGRDKILKFEGGYHGMSSEAQMSLAPVSKADYPRAQPDSAGIPQSVQAEMLIAPYNNLEFAASLIEQYRNQIAAIIVEPQQRVIPAVPGFLEMLRAKSDEYGIVLIFDEVVTGFRFAYGGAQETTGVIPDLCTLGKAIGGGFPLAAIAGREQIMRHFDKEIIGAGNWLMMVGTLSGNPVAAVAGLKTLEILRREGAYDTLRKNGETVKQILTRQLKKAGIPHKVVGHPTVFNVIFVDRDVDDYRDLLVEDASAAAKFQSQLIKNGILRAAGKFYVSLALEQRDFDATESAVESVVEAIAQS
ncbi:MAG: aspartate aminotransferase family protein [Acidiferrobacterales bacterium]|nr:aspartate aminotransferase family protein [Acidiferrobacterales bacterium]